MIFVSLSVLTASDQYVLSCLSVNINRAMTTDYSTEGGEKGFLIFFLSIAFSSQRAIIFAPKLIPFVQAVGLACFFFGMYKTA